MVHVISWRPLISEARVRSQAVPRETCSRQIDTGIGFVPSTSVTYCISFHQCSTLIFIYMFLLTDGQRGEVWEPCKRQCSFGNRKAQA